MRIFYNMREFYREVKPIDDMRDRLTNLGLMPFSVTGWFWERDITILLKACECHKDFHIMSAIGDGFMINRYEQGATLIKLAEGNMDPDLALDISKEYKAFCSFMGLEVRVN